MIVAFAIPDGKMAYRVDRPRETSLQLEEGHPDDP